MSDERVGGKITKWAELCFAFGFSALANGDGRACVTSDFQLFPFPPHLNTPCIKHSANDVAPQVWLPWRPSVKDRSHSFSDLLLFFHCCRPFFLILPGLLRGSNVSRHSVSVDVLGICGPPSLRCITSPASQLLTQLLSSSAPEN